MNSSVFGINILSFGIRKCAISAGCAALCFVGYELYSRWKCQRQSDCPRLSSGPCLNDGPHFSSDQCLNDGPRHNSDPYLSDSELLNMIMDIRKQITRSKNTMFPDLTDNLAINNYVKEQVKIAMLYTKMKYTENAMEHLVNVMVVWPEPTTLKQLNCMMPNTDITLFVNKLQELSKNLDQVCSSS